MILTNQQYDILKWIAQILLPAIGTLYYGLAGIWSLPYAQEIVGSLTVIDTFIGVLLGISTNTYNKGGSASKEV